jgi:5-methylcytosine-specific restriction enzyme A
MSIAPLHLCPYPRCRKLVSTGRCAAHARLADHRQNEDVRHLYRTERWIALRREVLREEPFCQPCLEDGFGAVPNRHVDHKVPHRGDLVLFWDRTNLQGLCHAHHSAKTGRGQ